LALETGDIDIGCMLLVILIGCPRPGFCNISAFSPPDEMEEATIAVSI
jgi:hypothetical protein